MQTNVLLGFEKIVEGIFSLFEAFWGFVLHVCGFCFGWVFGLACCLSQVAVFVWVLLSLS